MKSELLSLNDDREDAVVSEFEIWSRVENTGLL